MAEQFGSAGGWTTFRSFSPPPAPGLGRAPVPGHRRVPISSNDSVGARAAARGYDDGAGDPVLRYPASVGVAQDQGHWIIFDIFKQDPAKLQINRGIRAGKAALAKIANQQKLALAIDGFSEKAEKAAKKAGKHKGPNSIAVKNETTTKLFTSIGLYMPPSISVQYGAKYADQDIGRLAESIPSAIAAFQTEGGGYLDAGMVGVKGVAGKGVEMLLKNLPAGVKSVAEIYMGAIIAPRMELMFEGINRRNFSFAFQFVPKNFTESNTVKQIVNKFKFHMASNYGNPTSDILVGGTYTAGSDGVRNMTIPDFFEIKYMYKNGPNPHLNLIKKCVLQSMNVTYGDDRYKSYDDGAPQTTKMTLQFQELEIITKKYIDQGY